MTEMDLRSVSARRRRILILQQRQWGVGIGHEIAKRLHRDGYDTAALTFKKSTDAFTRNQKDVPYKLILNHDALFEKKTEPEITLKQICFELGVDSVWPLVMCLRNHVYCYRDKYYYSYRQNVSDEEITSYVKNAFHALKRLFDDFDPDAVMLPNFVALPHIMIALMARRRGKPVAAIKHSRVSGIYIASTSPYLDEGPFVDRVQSLNDGAKSLNDGRAAEYLKTFRDGFLCPDYFKQDDQKLTGFALLRNELLPILQVANFMRGRSSQNRVEGLGTTIDYRPPRIIIRDHYTAKRYLEQSTTRRYNDLAQLGSFVYLPLQVQPEAQIDMLAPHFANQIETARQVAIALPGDYTLAVKDHPRMMSRRSPSYHEKLARIPNVKLLDPRLPTKAILQRCDLVLSPGATTLVEAAFHRKPAIQFGQQGTTSILPNVERHSDMTTLTAAVNRALNRRDLHSEDYERRLRNYVAAAYDTGLEIKYDDIWYRGGTVEEYEAVYQTYRNAIEQKILLNGVSTGSML